MNEHVVRTSSGKLVRKPVPAVGRMERLPKWLNLVPMLLQWAWLGLRYRSLTLPSCANPHITAGGLVGDTRSEYFAGMGDYARSRVAPYTLLQVAGVDQLAAAMSAMREADLRFPVVAKPELGSCGFGVRRIDDALELADYLARYPAGESLMLQRYLDEPGEAGLFYVRHPEQAQGRVLGILLRHYPQVVGDGVSTMAQLIAADPRLRRVQHRPHEHVVHYNPRRIPAKGELVRLSLIGSTRVGGRCEDATSQATTELLAAVEAVASDMPAFHIGRFDVRYRNLQELRAGRFTIMEINGAGSEVVHAWDPRYSLREVYRMVFANQRVLFALGDWQRARGHQPIGLLALARHHLRQQRLMRRYPSSN